MTSSNFKMEVLSGPERRRRWSTAEKLAIIHETYETDATVSIVARRHGIQPNQLFAWRDRGSASRSDMCRIDRAADAGNLDVGNTTEGIIMNFHCVCPNGLFTRFSSLWPAPRTM
ncbi:hypothetical protein EMEDMD4_1310062 [Sinorhizobium medicae]|uniref:Transposase n=1 Tax=Sinorhizobium medicae TaxID=110321 RepID=A0A508WRC5_9HYPH|nr:hypothetical protein EMEDMD4_1310062 [Sinorhizobium medicae]